MDRIREKGRGRERKGDDQTPSVFGAARGNFELHKHLFLECIAFMKGRANNFIIFRFMPIFSLVFWAIYDVINLFFHFMSSFQIFLSTSLLPFFSLIYKFMWLLCFKKRKEERLSFIENVTKLMCMYVFKTVLLEYYPDYSGLIIDFCFVTPFI